MASKHLSASGAHEVDLKRVRRTAEPEFKSCADEALDRPWAELSLSQEVQFAMAQVCHFSHATFVQAESIPHFAELGNSVAVEAATGSGKTLAFILPTMERLVRHSVSHYRKYGTPLRSRRIVGAILSPNRVLAQQTFIVARSVACRATQIVRFVLCDASLHDVESIVAHLRRATRICGVILVGTPSDVDRVRCAVAGVPFTSVTDKADEEEAGAEGLDTTEDWREMAVMAATADVTVERSKPSEAVPAAVGKDEGRESEGLDEEELEALRIARAKRAARREKNTTLTSTSTTATVDEIATIAPNPDAPFLLIIDEADVVLKSTVMRTVIHRFLDNVKTANPDMALDVGLFGATISSAPQCNEFLASLKLPHPPKRITLASNEQYVSKLQNRFVYCAPQDMLQTLVHMINAHPTKKHFIFFNSVQVLYHVRNLMTHLMEGKRPMLHIGKIFTLHEEMRDAAKFSEFGRFLRYSGPEHEAAEKAAATKDLTIREQRKILASAAARADDAHKKTLEGFANGTRKTGSSLAKANGAVLLCTDVAAFGLDVRDVEYVLHFEAPTTVRSYIHRIGRVARMGMRGLSTMLLPLDPNADVDKDRVARMKEYVEMLTTAHHVEPASLAANMAPITSNIRAIIERSPELVESAMAAAPTMIETEGSWFSAGIAVDALTAGAGR